MVKFSYVEAGELKQAPVKLVACKREHDKRGDRSEDELPNKYGRKKKDDAQSQKDYMPSTEVLPRAGMVVTTRRSEI
ncbi:hypothetical protein ACP70R_008507 [Stipagrostis hirtigluma subsp. patula]